MSVARSLCFPRPMTCATRPPRPIGVTPSIPSPPLPSPREQSGTLGTKANTQMVIPKMTENYGASRDPPEKSAPMCTVHSFPHNIDHCLTWSRSEFEGIFSGAPTEALSYLEKPAEYTKAARSAGDAQARENLEKVVDVLVTSRLRTFEECVQWARIRFQDYFHDRIVQLTYTFPEDAPTSTGAPFWSPPKRFPRAVGFKSDDESHVRLVHAMATLKAEVYGVPLPSWHKDMAATAKVADAAEARSLNPPLWTVAACCQPLRCPADLGLALPLPCSALSRGTLFQRFASPLRDP